MKIVHALSAFGVILLLGSQLVRADAFDDKARAAATAEQAAARSKENAQKYAAITRNNMMMVRRIPRGATVTKCFELYASIYRHETNGCWLGDTEWNGIPVQICTDAGNDNLPPEIVECHYHIARTGQDCQIFRNASIKPRCF